MKINLQFITATEEGFRKKKNVTAILEQTSVIKNNLTEKDVEDGNLCQMKIQNRDEIISNISNAGYTETDLQYAEDILNGLASPKDETMKEELAHVALTGGLVCYKSCYPEKVYFSHPMYFYNDKIMSMILDCLASCVTEILTYNNLNVSAMSLYLYIAAELIHRNMYYTPTFLKMHNDLMHELLSTPEIPISPERKTYLFLLHIVISVLDIEGKKIEKMSNDKMKIKTKEIDEATLSTQIVRAVYQHRATSSATA